MLVQHTINTIGIGLVDDLSTGSDLPSHILSTEIKIIFAFIFALIRASFKYVG